MASAPLPASRRDADARLAGQAAGARPVRRADASRHGRSLVIAACLALPSMSALAQADVWLRDPSFPKRAPGLWEVRTASGTAHGLAPMLNCVGDATDDASSNLDRSAGAKGACTLGGFQRVGQAWVAESVCKEGRTRVVSKAIAAGDFQSHYRIDTSVTYDPPLGGVRKEDKEAIVARHLGPCLGHHKPGDMVVPGMGTLNMIDGTFRAEPSPAPRSPARKKPPEKSSGVIGLPPADSARALTFIPEVDNGS